jgi:hypothetical protein
MLDRPVKLDTELAQPHECCVQPAGWHREREVDVAAAAFAAELGDPVKPGDRPVA